VEIELGGVKVATRQEPPKRLSLLLWGAAGTFKTTISATAPGKKLWLLFDDGGTDSITSLREQTLKTCPESALCNELAIVDFSHERNNLISKFKNDDGLGLGKILSNDDIGIDTVVVDSVTRASQMGLELAISMGLTRGSKLETPGIPAFGARNALMLRMITDIMNVTGRYNKNVIFICHEGEPSTTEIDGKSVIVKVTMSLGGQLPNLVTQKLGECWFVQDTGKERKIILRPFRTYKPMKSRMFDLSSDKPGEFVWKYDINNPDPKFEIATWYNQWKDGNGQKIQVPK